MAPSVIIKVCQVKQDSVGQRSFELGDKERWKMKPHAVGVEEGQAAMATIEIRNGESGPILLFVAQSLLGNGRLVRVIIKRLPLPKTHATTKLDAFKGVSNQMLDVFVFQFHF